MPVILDQQNVESRLAARFPALRRRGWVAPARVDVWKWRSYERGLVRRVQRTVAVWVGCTGLPQARAIGLGNGPAQRRGLAVPRVRGPLGEPRRPPCHDGHARVPPEPRRSELDDRSDPPARARVASLRSPGPRGCRRPGIRCERAETPWRSLAVSRMYGPSWRSRSVRRAPSGGRRTRLKLLEAFAVGLPTVATTIASAGIDVRHGIDVATADDEEVFAAEIVRLLDDVRSTGDGRIGSAACGGALRLAIDRGRLRRDLYDVVRNR